MSKNYTEAELLGSPPRMGELRRELEAIAEKKEVRADTPKTIREAKPPKKKTRVWERRESEKRQQSRRHVKRRDWQNEKHHRGNNNGQGQSRRHLERRDWLNEKRQKEQIRQGVRKLLAEAINE